MRSLMTVASCLLVVRWGRWSGRWSWRIYHREVSNRLPLKRDMDEMYLIESSWLRMDLSCDGIDRSLLRNNVILPAQDTPSAETSWFFLLPRGVQRARIRMCLRQLLGESSRVSRLTICNKTHADCSRPFLLAFLPCSHLSAHMANSSVSATLLHTY